MSDSPKIRPLLNNKQVCELLGISQKMWREIRSEHPKPVAFTKNKYTLDDLEKWQRDRSQSRSARLAASAR